MKESFGGRFVEAQIQRRISSLNPEDQETVNRIILDCRKGQTGDFIANIARELSKMGQNKAIVKVAEEVSFELKRIYDIDMGLDFIKGGRLQELDIQTDWIVSDIMMSISRNSAPGDTKEEDSELRPILEGVIYGVLSVIVSDDCGREEVIMFSDKLREYMKGDGFKNKLSDGRVKLTPDFFQKEFRIVLQSG